jgi:hypothetical protein
MHNKEKTAETKYKQSLDKVYMLLVGGIPFKDTIGHITNSYRSSSFNMNEDLDKVQARADRYKKIRNTLLGMSWNEPSNILSKLLPNKDNTED